MRNGSKSKDVSALSNTHADEVQALALKALDLLASNRETNAQDKLSNDIDIPSVCRSYLSDQEFHRHETISALRESGVSVNELVDFVIPRTAQHLQALWHSDQISFAEVTIAAARLQETLHILAISNLQESANPQARIFLIVPRQERHTLGIFVIAHQLRREGYQVDLALGLTSKQIKTKLKTNQFHMIGITCAGSARFYEIKTLVRDIRDTLTKRTPIVLGGSYISEGLDLKKITGCDHVTNDIHEAITFCGLKSSRRDDNASVRNTDLEV